MARKRGPVRLGALIPDITSEWGVSRRLDEARVEAVWKAVAGGRIEAVTSKVRFREGRLVVQLNSAAWRQALHMQRDDWRRRVNESLGEEQVLEIVFR